MDKSLESSTLNRKTIESLDRETAKILLATSLGLIESPLNDHISGQSRLAKYVDLVPDTNSVALKVAEIS